MKSIISLVIIISLNVISCFAQDSNKNIINPEDSSKWVLIWEDNFSYDTKDSLFNEWIAENRGNKSILSSRWKENILITDSGTLQIINKKESRGGQDWTSGSIWTKQKFKYGYYECRYKYAAANATNNSFWLGCLEPDLNQKYKFEIDVNEGKYPNIISTNIHKWVVAYRDSSHSTSLKRFSIKDVDLSKEYHLFGLEWTEKELIFYLDRKEIRREKNIYCHSLAKILLSLAIITWDGKVEDRIDNTYMEVDYVKVYHQR